MGYTVAQNALCLPVSAGYTILPSCSWRMLPRSQPCSHPAHMVEGEEDKGHQTPGNHSTWCSSSSSPTSGGWRRTSSYCWLGPATPSFITSCPIYLFLKSWRATEGTEGPNFLLHTGTCPSQYGTQQIMGYQVARQVLSHHQHPPKPR